MLESAEVPLKGPALDPDTWSLPLSLQPPLQLRTCPPGVVRSHRPTCGKTVSLPVGSPVRLVVIMLVGFYAWQSSLFLQVRLLSSELRKPQHPCAAAADAASTLHPFPMLWNLLYLQVPAECHPSFSPFTSPLPHRTVQVPAECRPYFPPWKAPNSGGQDLILVRCAKLQALFLAKAGKATACRVYRAEDGLSPTPMCPSAVLSSELAAAHPALHPTRHSHPQDCHGRGSYGRSCRGSAAAGSRHEGAAQGAIGR